MVFTLVVTGLFMLGLVVGSLISWVLDKNPELLEKLEKIF